MRLFAIVLMLSITGALFLAGTEVSAQEKKDNQDKPKIVLVKMGDTLSKIAKHNDTTYKRLFNANKNIKDPDLIYPGDKVRVPNKNEKLKNRLTQSAPVVSSSQTKSSSNTTSYPAQGPTNANYNGGVWDKLAACESGGNWSINTGNGYYGGLQFNVGTWRSNGGSGYPHQASKSEQIRIAKNLHASRGFSPWPACSAKLGLH
jgi:murein DD-endopeptidase MepM/ murein hydrolase activator NlpD